MFFRSERLFLRPGWPEDWSELFRQIADTQIVRNLANAPWPYGAAVAPEFAAPTPDRRFPQLFITLPNNVQGSGNDLIGCIGLHQYATAAPGEPELGYWIARDRWGQGFATEAVRAILAIARGLGHRRVHASLFADNPAAARVLAKVGFRPTGANEPRFSLGRGEIAPAQIHALELARVGGGSDGDLGGEDVPMPRVA